eukprot:TRINITY_DN6316_c0_g1_i1.p1 TRINITY_DN6316_c0_g1~~TRINITY_DN6316_c0_g1_i1.p1  ORF type:complete len:309 (+),score=42.91 TRINITY_DN6316_c0_g1_i1:57-929(+)
MAASLRNRVAIITGASRGIGRECALTLAKAGVNIVVCAKSTDETPNLPGTIFTVAKEVESFGAQALPVKCDVRIDSDLENVVKATISKFGRIDIVINNAGALWWKNVDETPLKRYDLINQVNSRASFALTSLCLPYMLKQRWGHVITMSPPIDMDMLKGKVAYCISKFGMTLLAHGLAQETAGKGVASNALWPATMVESFATINFALGERASWRKASILADSVLEIVKEDPNLPSGRALIDEDFLRTKGVTDFTKYRCDPNIEPPRMARLPFDSTHNVGLVAENSKRSKL